MLLAGSAPGNQFVTPMCMGRSACGAAGGGRVVGVRPAPAQCSHGSAADHCTNPITLTTTPKRSAKACGCHELTDSPSTHAVASEPRVGRLVLAGNYHITPFRYSFCAHYNAQATKKVQKASAGYVLLKGGLAACSESRRAAVHRQSRGEGRRARRSPPVTTASCCGLFPTSRPPIRPAHAATDLDAAF